MQCRLNNHHPVCLAIGNTLWRMDSSGPSPSLREFLPSRHSSWPYKVHRSFEIAQKATDSFSSDIRLPCCHTLASRSVPAPQPHLSFHKPSYGLHDAKWTRNSHKLACTVSLPTYTKRIASSSVANVLNSVRTAERSNGLWDSY